MATAIVTGATGILGREIVQELGKHPDQWSKVHALSRNKKEEYPPNAIHGFIDLLASPGEMVKQLRDVDAEYVFFAAYLQRQSEQENWDVNGDMLQNFLDALESTGATRKMKRIVLVTGAKQYGVHLGPTKNPMLETDPWLTDKKWPPNFYYRQQDILKSFCDKNKHISWVVTYPNDVIGFAKGNFMNLATSLALYAAVTKEMGEEELVFPGSAAFYTKFDCFTWSKLHARFCAWAALETKVANQAFNVVNGDVESWQNMFPLLARRFRLRVKADQFKEPPGEESSTMSLSEQPPLSVLAAQSGLVGTLKPGKVEQRIDLVRWGDKKEVKDAWQRLAQREGLQQDAFEKATWGFLGFVLGRDYDLVISMTKARNFGWDGYEDSWAAFCDTFDELEKEKILPRSH